jgi:hypothetical protein
MDGETLPAQMLRRTETGRAARLVALDALLRDLCPRRPREDEVRDARRKLLPANAERMPERTAA